LARHAILEWQTARFYSVVDLVNQLDAEKRAGRAGHLTNRLLNQDALCSTNSATCPSRRWRIASVPSDQQALERVSLIAPRTCPSANGARCSACKNDQPRYLIASRIDAKSSKRNDSYRFKKVNEVGNPKKPGPKIKGMPRSPLSRLPMQSILRDPGTSAANRQTAPLPSIK